MKILVTNCTRHAGLAAMRALARAGCEVFGADDRRLPLGLRSRFAAGGYEHLPREDDPALGAALDELIERTQPDVLIPFRCSEYASRHGRSLLRHTHALLPEPAAYARLNDKSELLELCSQLGVPAPRRFGLDEAIEQLRRDAASPIVVKPCRDVGAGAGVSFIADPGRLADAAAQVAAAYGKALVTEYIPGPTSHLRAVHLLFDDDSRLIAYFIVQKQRLWPCGVGATVAGISTHETALVRQILPIFKALRWRGPADAELKFDARDGQMKILEINPRFSGIVHFPIACGVNFPLLYARAALGERFAEDLKPRYAAGMRYLSLPRWMRSLAAELREQSGSRLPRLVQALRREWRGPRVSSIHELLDPAPTLGRLLLAAMSASR
jgi:predicted ATP-grasp superfamily ATP-dependent carboligase